MITAVLPRPLAADLTGMPLSGEMGGYFVQEHLLDITKSGHIIASTGAQTIPMTYMAGPWVQAIAALQVDFTITANLTPGVGAGGTSGSTSVFYAGGDAWNRWNADWALDPAEIHATFSIVASGNHLAMYHGAPDTGNITWAVSIGDLPGSSVDYMLHIRVPWAVYLRKAMGVI